MQKLPTIIHNPQAHRSVSDMHDVAFDLDEILPLEFVREHTKTDDIPTVTDEQLLLYRSAAFEAAEAYTGLIFTKKKAIIEEVERPKPVYGDWGVHVPQRHRHYLRFPVAEPRIYYYGLKSMAPQELHVAVGKSYVDLPVHHLDFMGMNCCNPCGNSDEHYGRLQYMAGYSCVEELPSILIQGVLKYIAHSVENPGDVVITVTQAGIARNQGARLYDASNPSLASGAIELWRVLKSDAI